MTTKIENSLEKVSSNGEITIRIKKTTRDANGNMRSVIKFFRNGQLVQTSRTNEYVHLYTADDIIRTWLKK